MQTIELPASVKGRACFNQFVGGLAVDQAYFDQALAQIKAVGMTAIWAANDKNPPSTFNPSVYAIAAHLATKGVPILMPDAKSESNLTDEQGIPPYVITNGTAVIPVNGPLSKQSSSLNSLFGGSNTVGMRKALALAMSDSRVQRVMFHIDSPGGTVAGTGDLGDDIFAASAKKPIASYIEDMGTSAAYWIASQTARVYASKYANIGSIGVIWTVYDTSAAYEKDGIKVHAITSSPGKAFHVDGMPITKKQMDKMQAHVDSTYNHFLSAVARGRGVDMAAARKMSGDADIYDANAAMDLGLVDGVMSFSDALLEFTAHDTKLLRTGITHASVSRLMPLSSTTIPPVELVFADAPTHVDFTGNVFVVVGGGDVPDAGGSGFSSPSDIVALRSPPVTPEPESASPKAVAPVSLTPEAHAALVAKADKGEQALKIVQEMQANAATAAKAALDSARERIMADYGASKEQVQACSDLASLGALESVYRSKDAKRSGADGKSAAQPKDTSAEAEAAAEIAEFKASQMKTAATFNATRTPEV